MTIWITSQQNTLYAQNAGIHNAYRLPEREEDDQLNANDLKRRPVLAQLLLELDVELHQAEHSHSNTGTLKTHHPDVSKGRVQRVLAVPPKNFRYHRDDGERHADHTVLEDSSPNYVKPSKAGSRLPERPTVFAASTLLHEEHAPEPIHGRQRAEELLLLMQARRHVLAHEREETRNGKRLVAVSQHLEVDGMSVVQHAEKRHRRVNRNHKQDADDVLLLAGHEVVRGMAVDEVEGDEDGDEAEYYAEAQAEFVEGDAAVCWPEGILFDAQFS